MKSCDRRVRTYRNGKTFDQSKEVAEEMNLKLQKQILSDGKVLWSELLEKVEHDELVYKLTLKYLRRDGFDIGDWKKPQITKSI